MQDNLEIQNKNQYIRTQNQIYDIATNQEILDWKSFLLELINKEGLDPFNIDLTILTQKYLTNIEKLKKIDFNLSAKFLTIAVYLLKTKTDFLIQKEIRGIDEKINQIENSNQDQIDELENLEDLDFNQLDFEEKKKKYTLKYKNPLARKRKVTIYDLIKTLEKTLEQSNKRRANFLQRKNQGKYTGPIYQKKPKDLKQLIDELYEFIINEISKKNASIHFSSIIYKTKNKMEILEKFIPLLHLKNHNKIDISQEKHFSEIKIHKTQN